MPKSLREWRDAVRSLPSKTRVFVDGDVYAGLVALVMENYRFVPFVEHEPYAVRIAQVTIMPKWSRRVA